MKSAVPQLLEAAEIGMKFAVVRTWREKNISRWGGG